MPAGAAAEVRAALDGEVPLPPSVRAVIAAWRSGAPFGLALTGDPHRAEEVFRALRPHAVWVARRAEIDELPPRNPRALALCTDPAALPPAVLRRCTAVVDIGAEPARGRRPAGESETRLWLRVVRLLAAHGVHDGAVDVAACTLASALVETDVEGDPVALVRAWVGEPRGRASAEGGRPEAGEADPLAGGDDEGDEAADAVDVSAAVESDVGDAGDAGDAGDEGDGENVGGAADGADAGEGPGDPADSGSPEREADAGADARADGDRGGDDADALEPASEETVSPWDDRPASELDGGASPTPAGPAPDGPTAEAPDAGFAIDAEPDPGSSPRAVALAAPELLDALDRASVRAGRRARRGPHRAGVGRGRPGRVVAPEHAGGRIAMLPTLHRALRRRAMTGAVEEFAVTRDDLRGRLRAEPTAAHTVVVVDGSSSMGSAGAAHARRVADVALAHVSHDRGEVSVVLAAGSCASVVQERTLRVSRARAALQRASAGGGGGTPLADAVRRALDELGDAPRERCRLVIVSDGQATVDLAGRADPRTAARDLRVQLDRAASRTARCVFVPLDARGYTPLERTLAPFRAAGVVIAAD
ncbi:VWA domain-containing protein [Microbacterium sp. Kw_RZR3]|nr:VWA domain-containing protein [Microbacterium sp. Kw_RZR3]MDF2044766.1 VWA domain-containing protein [Microbacterium sp. Kw_RZR3]